MTDYVLIHGACMAAGAGRACVACWRLSAPGVHADADRPRRTLPPLEPRRRASTPMSRMGQSHDLGGPARHRPGRGTPTAVSSHATSPTGCRTVFARSIYLDAFVPENGKALFDYLPDGGESLRELAVAHGDGWKIPPIPASVFASMRRTPPGWTVSARCYPLSSCEAPARLSGACDGIATIGYIVARGHDGPFGPVLRQGWRARLVAGGACMRA